MRSFDVLICSWINGWVNNWEAGDLRRHRAHYDFILMKSITATSYQYAMASQITRNVTLLNNLFRVTTRKPSRLCIATLCWDSTANWRVGLCYDTIFMRDGCILQQVEWHSVADIIISGVTNGRLPAMFRNGCLIICRNKVYIGHTSAMWHESYVCGSSHGTVAVLLPGFAINW